MLLAALFLVSLAPELQSKAFAVPVFLDSTAKDTIMVFTQASAGFTKWEPQDRTELRGRPVTISSEITSPVQLSEESVLLFLLFDGKRLTGRITKIHGTSGNTVRVIGKFIRQTGFFTLSADTSRVFAHLYLRQPRRYYRISYSDILKSHLLVELDPREIKILPGSPPLTPPDTSDTANDND